MSADAFAMQTNVHCGCVWAESSPKMLTLTTDSIIYQTKQFLVLKCVGKSIFVANPSGQAKWLILTNCIKS